LQAPIADPRRVTFEDEAQITLKWFSDIKQETKLSKIEDVSTSVKQQQSVLRDDAKNSIQDY